MTDSAAPLSTTNGCGMDVHSLAISHRVRFQPNCSARSLQSSGPSCILLCLLTHFHSRPVFLLSPLHILHMTLMHHCRSQTSPCFGLVFFSCRDFAQRWPRSCFYTRICRLPARVLIHVAFTRSSERATPRALSSDLVARFLAVFLHNSSTELAYWCTRRSGPTRPIRSCFGVLFPFPFPFPFPFSLPFPFPFPFPVWLPTSLFLSPCVLVPCFLPFLASPFLCQDTTLPCVPTDHSCSTLLLLTRNSLPCVPTGPRW